MKGKKIILVLVVLLILIATGVFAFVKTDIFKTDKQLFYKYLSKNIDAFTEDMDVNTLKNLFNNLNEKDATSSGEFRFDGLKEIIGQEKDLSFNFDLATDKANKKMKVNYAINVDEEEILAFNFLKDDEKYALKCDEITDSKYIAVENKNLKELAKKLGIENVEEIPDKIEYKEKEIDEGKLELIKDKYVGLVDELIAEEKYIAENEVKINIDDKEITTNKYSLNLTQKEIYDIVAKVLDTLKDDDETLNFYLDLANVGNSEDLKLDTLKKNIKEYIEEDFIPAERDIKENESITVSIYESKGKTVKTEILVDSKEDIIYSVTYRENGDDNFRLETSTAKDKENGIYAACDISVDAIIHSEKDKIEVTIIAKEEYDKNDIKKLEKDEDLSYYADSYKDSNIELKYNITEITDAQMKFDFYGKVDGKNITTFKGNTKVVEQVSKMEGLTNENATILNDCSEEEIKEIFAGISTKAIMVLPQKIDKIVPGFSSMFTPSLNEDNTSNVMNEENNDSNLLTGGSETEGIKEELNAALKKCQDNYFIEYMSNQEADVNEYLSEENVKNYCDGASNIVFTDYGIDYTSTDGTEYEAIINMDMSSGYITIDTVTKK